MFVSVGGISEADTGLAEINVMVSSNVQINNFTFLRFIFLHPSLNLFITLYIYLAIEHHSVTGTK